VAEKENNSAQNIDGVLEQLKQSYSADATSADDIIDSENISENVSHDELQARLRSQFLDGGEKKFESYEDDYSIDEDFLRDAYNDDGTEDLKDKDIEKENENGICEETFQEDKKNAFEEEIQEEDQSIKETSFIQSMEEVQEKEFEEEIEADQEIELYEKNETLQEKEYNEALEEIHAQTQVEEIQEIGGENIQISDNSQNIYFEDDEDYTLWHTEEKYNPIDVSDDDDVEKFVDAEDDDMNTFEWVEDTRTDAEKAEDRYVGVFYRSNEHDPYDNMSFKERILEKAPTVDTLEAELNENSEQSDFSVEKFDEVQSMPLELAGDEQIEENSDSGIEELDRSDLALLLEFGYTEEVLKNVSNEKIEELSNDEFMDEIAQESQEESGLDSQNIETQKQVEQDRPEKLKHKLKMQYGAYRKKRGEILLRLIISAVFAFVLFVFELIGDLKLSTGGIFNREEYFFAYVLVGLQILIFAALPAVKKIYASFKNLLSAGMDAYFLAGVAAAITVLYDFIVVFERTDIPTTFHFCAAIVIVSAELCEFMKLNAEIRNYEYYFSEYIFDEDITEVDMYKYTLVKSEGRGSIAEKMYLGGLDEKTKVYFPQAVESLSGFFEASKVSSKRNKATYGWVIVSTVVAFMFTIVSGIIYEEVWVAAAAFLLTFNLMMPIIAIVAEWLPFERLSAQNYVYGAAFASEGAAESIDKCDMLVFNDLHIFEKCDAKSVNLAIYDSTSKTTLLSCLNSVYSEIGGPLQSAFANTKIQSFGKCKINRIARSGVEAFVGSSYSVLIGDEQFMSRYGVVFPKAALSKEEDKIFTLCVSINNRATARIAVKYKINETFYNIVQKLLEDKIYCVVQTYDPMISAELVARVRPYKGAPVNVVHKSSADYALDKHKHKAGALYSVMGEELSVLARGSRLNLAVALSNAKKLRKLRGILNICSGVLISVGAIVALMLVLSEKLSAINWLVVFIYWIISGAVMAGIMFWKFPQNDRFIFNKK